MVEENFDLDDLLNELDEAEGHKINSNGNTVKFIPHPPREVSPVHHGHNPKTKFAVAHSQQQHSYPLQSGFTDKQTTKASSYACSNSYSASGSRGDNQDENSLDNLLQMLSSPRQENTSSFSPQGSPVVPLYKPNPIGTVFTPEKFQSGQNSFESFGLSNKLAFTATETAPTDNDSNKGKNNRCSAGEDWDEQSSAKSNNKPDGNLSRRSENNSSNSLDRYNSNNTSSFLNGVGSTNMGSPSSLASRINSFSTKEKPSTTPIVSSGKIFKALKPSGGTNSKTRCSKVILAGTGRERGHKSSAFSKTVCDHLRCLDCNFTVVCFVGSEWDASADYMFFRNNTPNEAKLSPLLKTSSEASAYCCQCSWTSADSDREPSQHPKNFSNDVSGGELHWVCAGH